MIYKHVTVLTLCIWGILVVSSCSSQPPENCLQYTACEPRASNDPGRLNIRASAEGFGAITPCTGRLEVYINPNSQTRSLILDLEYRNLDGESAHQQQIRADLKSSSTGMFQKEIIISPVEGETCRALRITIYSITCYSADDNEIDCPEVRIIPPDAYESIHVEDDTLDVCTADT